MKYFNTKEASNILGYNDDSYIRRLISSGRLKAKKNNNQWVISENDLSDYKISIDIKSKYKKLLEFNQTLRKIAEGILDNESKVVGPKDFISILSLGRGYKIHEAILMLCKNGFGEDASILARTLFDLMVTYLYILKDKTDSTAYRYFDYDWVLRKKMFDYVKGKREIMKLVEDRQSNPLPFDSTIDEVEKYADKANKKHGYTTDRWSDKNLHDMAKVIGRLDAYKTVYFMQCQLSHNLSRGMNEFSKTTPDGIVMEIGKSENWVEESLVVAFDFYYCILSTFNDYFELGLEKEILELEERYVKEIGSINGE